MSKKKTKEQFQIELNKLKNNEFTVLGDYNGNKVKTLVRHNICGYEWEVIPCNILKKDRWCPKCSKNIKNKTTDYFKKEVFELVGDEYSVLGEYSKALEKIKMRHNKCNYEYLVTPHDFISSNNRCPKCYGNIKLTTDSFKDRVYELEGNEYSVLGEYKNIDTKILIKHNTCENEYLVTPYKFIHRKQRCPNCTSSKGEIKILNFLKSNNVKFKPQYEIDGLVGIGGKNLRFDFAIFDNDKLLFLLEYDGEFHFSDVYSNSSHDKIKKHDKIKNEYCLKNNISLIRIPYFEFDNIEKILYKLIPR